MTTANPNPNIDSAVLLRNAEIKAERLVAILRMAIAVGLAFSFAVSVWPQGADLPPVLSRQWAYAGITLGAYFTLGLVSWIGNRRGYYRPWMAWPIATTDCLFLLLGIWLSIQNTGLAGGHLFVFPSVWLAPLVLTFGALRFNPLLQAYITVVIVSGLFVMARFVATDAISPQAQSMAFFLTDPPNYMRVSMLGLAGIVLVVASARTRALLKRSIAEARHSANLTRYLPAQLAPRLAEGGLEELRRGKRQALGVLFIDMRGFTSWSQGRTPQEISTFMSEFRVLISKTARSTGGIIDKFMGDAAMIVFEDDTDPQAAAQACIRCAQDLADEIHGWSAARVSAGQSEVRAGVGAHWGEVFIGVIGDSDRLEFSVFGDTVNTAARLEEMTKSLGVDIIASADIISQAGLGANPEGWTDLEGVPVRGRTGTIGIMGRMAG